MNVAIIRFVQEFCGICNPVFAHKETEVRYYGRSRRE